MERRNIQRPAGTATLRRADGAIVFLLALALRLLFWEASADFAAASTPFYRGDAQLWLELARDLQAGLPYEQGVPLHPPGTAWVVAALWSGEASGVASLGLAWCFLGATAALLLHGAARRTFDPSVALLTGLAAAAASGLIVLSASLDSETPYLLLVAASLYVWAPLAARPSPWRLLAWGGLAAAATLLRPEHLLFFLPATGLLVVRWRWLGHRTAVARGAAATAVYALLLLPWHLVLWQRVEALQRVDGAEPPASGDAIGRVEESLRWLPWEPEAEARIAAMPAVARRTARGFVAATVAWRGGAEVTERDVDEVLQEAFGVVPGPLPARPFVSLYGGLNFYLANHRGSRGGFSRGPLAAPPPLVGGAERYPPALVAGLPPDDLALAYPPHLSAVTDGRALGWRWIREHPAEAARLAGEKLRLWWQGAATGFGGFNLPLGWDGERRPVDMAVPTGPLAAAWRGLVLVLALAGAWSARGMGDLAPWAIFLLGRLAVAAAFFGYARHGALVAPVVALLVAAAALHRLPGLRRRLEGRRGPWWRDGVTAAAALLLALELGRLLAGPVVLVDGRPPTQADLADHGPRRVAVRLR